MLGKADKDIADVIRLLSSRIGALGYLMPTQTELAQSSMDAGGQLSGYLRRSGLHDYSSQPIGPEAQVSIKTWIVEKDGLIETKASLYRLDVKMGSPCLWINDLDQYVESGILLALIVHEGELYAVNTSQDGILQSAEDPGSALGRIFDLIASVKSNPLDDKFSEWNLRLLRSFFSEASKNEEVFLRVDRQLLDQLGQDIGGDKSFVDAVIAGPVWARRGTSMVERVLGLVRQRKAQAVKRPASYKDPGDFDPAYRGVCAPTYLPYLAALVRNDSEHPAGYYDGLRGDLKLEHGFGSNEMEMMETAWRDLQQWTGQFEGKYGWFKLRTLGGYSRIGVPRSQSILQQSDVEDISHAFVQAEIRPGHEISEQEVTRILHEARASDRFYSAAFRIALNNNVFEQPIRTAIAAAYMDWDGTLPTKTANSGAGKKEPNASMPTEVGITLCLAVDHHEPLRLSPRWWVPSLQDSGHFRLTYTDGVAWVGEFIGTEGSISARAAEEEKSIWRIAEQAYDGSKQFQLKCFPSGDSEPTKAEISLHEKQLWILTPFFDGMSGCIELRERDLPASGQAYLLASPRNAQRLREYLLRLQPDHMIISAEGLPIGWLLVCIHECGALSSDQRLLPDGEGGAHPKPRAIRFVGGRSVRRGYSKMYLPYDLPTIELDAPDGTHTACPPGLRLFEEKYQYFQDAQEGVHFKHRKRFRIELASSNSASYELRAIRNGTILGQAKLRIAGLGGEMVDTGRPFSLDNVGRPVASSMGLSGVLPPSEGDESVDNLYDKQVFELPASKIGTPHSEASRLASARELFLDSLAQSGSIDYGAARDQIKRLMLDADEEGDPPLVLLDLRSRGYIEISTTHKGHISRIHAVAPTIFELPLSSSGRRAYGVTGTLRISHWDRIEKESTAWSCFRTSGTDHGFKPLCLLSEGIELVRSKCAHMGLRFSGNPSTPMAQWSSDIRSVRDETFHNPMESIGGAQESALRFNAAKGHFTAKPTHSSCELYRVRDLDTGMDNIYVLSDHGKFAFVRDSRWGVWIALDAFAQWASKLPGMDGVHPIPITYSEKDGTFWLPARISLPVVLERALVFCRGDTPEVLQIRHATRHADCDRISLSIHEGLPPVLTVNGFYNEMKEGKWLAYRYVPRRIASIVAEKIGASLDVI